MVRKIISIALILFCTRVSVFAQAIQFSLEMDNVSYVVGEHVTCKVKITNVGDKPLVIDDFTAFRNNRLFFEIYEKPNELYPQARTGKIIEEMNLHHNEGEGFDVDLSEWYELVKPAHLFIRAILVCNGKRYESNVECFDIVPGIELARLVQFIPGSPSIERTIRLVYWNRKGRELAFLCASDSPTGIIWLSLPLGDVVRVRKASIMDDCGDSAMFSVYRQATRDMLVRTIVQSDRNGIKIVKQSRAIEAVSSPMVDSIREAIENAPEK